MTENTQIDLTTIGFTRTSAESFFTRLRDAGVRTVVDVRLNNRSQLAGFAKAGDLAWFLEALGGIGYRHEPLLAPTADILDPYRRKEIGWPAYERRFLDLMAARRIEARLDPAALDGACLLCSEDTPHRCHRRLIAEYLRDAWRQPLSIRHL